jgi:hypothetical protein
MDAIFAASGTNEALLRPWTVINRMPCLVPWRDIILNEENDPELLIDCKERLKPEGDNMGFSILTSKQP